MFEHSVGQWIDHCSRTAGGKNWHAMTYHARRRGS
jgi:hypothetical protein